MHLVRKTSEYRGYSINLIQTGFYYNAYYGIFKDGEPYTIMCLHTEKACRNVIDTHENNKLLAAINFIEVPIKTHKDAA